MLRFHPRTALFPCRVSSPQLIGFTFCSYWWALHPTPAASVPQTSGGFGRAEIAQTAPPGVEFSLYQGSRPLLSFPLPAHAWATLLLSLELKLIFQRASERRGKVPGAWAVPPAI